MILRVRVTPSARKSAVLGFREDILRVSVRAVPERGKANGALICLLAEVLDIPKSQIHILSGHSGRVKRVEIAGKTEEQVRARLSGALP